MAEPEIRRLVETPVVAVRVTVPMADVDVGALVNEHLPGVFRRAPSLGVEIAGAPYVRYHAWGGDVADVELGFPVVAPASAMPSLADVAPGAPGAAALPGGRAAVFVHVGPYAGLPAAYRHLDEWCRARGLAPAGAPWESYVDDPDSVAPEAVRTEIVFPLAAEA